MEDNSERVQECIKTLRELLEEEEDLKIRTDDKFLMRYLRWVDFKPEVAFKRIKRFYEFRAENKEWFCCKPPSDYKTELDMNIGAVLRHRDSKGRRVYVVKMAHIDTDIMTPQLVSHLDDMWIESIIDEEETQKNGLAIIIDLDGYSWSMYSWLTPHNSQIASRKMLSITLRNVELHVVNTSFLLNASLAFIYPFLNSTVKEHIYFHGQDWESLHEHINPEILPEEYEGYGPELEYEELRKIIYDKSDDLMGTFSMGYINS